MKTKAVVLLTVALALSINAKSLPPSEEGVVVRHTQEDIAEGCKTGSHAITLCEAGAGEAGNSNKSNDCAAITVLFLACCIFLIFYFSTDTLPHEDIDDRYRKQIDEEEPSFESTEAKVDFWKSFNKLKVKTEKS